MKREEILEKSRTSKEDEGVQYIENKSRKYGVIAFTTMFFIITIFNHINKIDNDIAKILFLAYLSAEAFGRYKIGNEKFFLVTTIASGLASVLTFIVYAFVTVGVWG